MLCSWLAITVRPLQHPHQVNKKFNARHMCDNRVYQYYLPASMLGEEGCGAGVGEGGGGGGDGGVRVAVGRAVGRPGGTLKGWWQRGVGGVDVVLPVRVVGLGVLALSVRVA